MSLSDFPRTRVQFENEEQKNVTSGQPVKNMLKKYFIAFQSNDVDVTDFCVLCAIFNYYFSPFHVQKNLFSVALFEIVIQSPLNIFLYFGFFVSLVVSGIKLSFTL